MRGTFRTFDGGVARGLQGAVKGTEERLNHGYRRPWGPRKQGWTRDTRELVYPRVAPPRTQALGAQILGELQQ